MSAPVAQISVQARLDTHGLERQVNQQLSRIQKKTKFNPINSADVRASTMALGSMTQGADEFGKSMAAANARVLAFGASAGAIYAVGSAFRELVSSTVDVEKRLASINVILNATKSELVGFSKDLFKIAKDTGQAFSTVADSANELARQGLTTAETLKRTRDAMVLVRLSGLDAKASVEALTAALNTFTDAGLDSTKVINKLANLDAAFAVSTGDLAEALKRSASAASTAGVQFEDLGALITTIKQKTALNAPVIGNAIKSIFTKIQRPKTIEQLKAMNIQVEDGNGLYLNSLQILDNVAKKFNTLTQAQQQQVKMMAGGLYQVNQLMAAISDLSNEYSIFGEAQRVAMKEGDSALARNARLNETLAAQINKVTESFREMGSLLGKDIIGPALGKLLKIGEKLSEFFTPRDGQGMGANLGKGLLEGLGKAISGPGLGIAVAGVLVLFKEAAKFAGTAFRQIMGINDATQQQRNLQKAINDMLRDNPQLIAQSVARASSLAAVQKDILNTIRQQGAMMEANSKIAARTLPMAARGGVGINPRTGNFRAAGHVPETNKNKVAQERSKAFASGYEPGAVRSMNMKGMGRVTYNDAEDVKFLGGYSQPFINPPKNTAAGKKHRLRSIRETGIDPYSTRPHYQNLKSDGFVPNFSLGMMNMFRGIETHHLRQGLGKQDALYGRGGVFSHRAFKGDLPKKPADLLRTLEGHVQNSYRGISEFTSSGFDPFLSASLSKGVASDFAIQASRPGKAGFGLMGGLKMNPKNVFDESSLFDFYKKSGGSLEPLYKLARTQGIGFNTAGFKNSVFRRGADLSEEQEISLMLPNLFGSKSKPIGTARGSLMKLGYPEANPYLVSDLAKNKQMFGSKAEMKLAYPDDHLHPSIIKVPPTLDISQKAVDYASLKHALGVAEGFVPNFNLRALLGEKVGLGRSFNAYRGVSATTKEMERMRNVKMFGDRSSPKNEYDMLRTVFRPKKGFERMEVGDIPKTFADLQKYLHSSLGWSSAGITSTSFSPRATMGFTSSSSPVVGALQLPEHRIMTMPKMEALRDAFASRQKMAPMIHGRPAGSNVSPERLAIEYVLAEAARKNIGFDMYGMGVYGRSAGSYSREREMGLLNRGGMGESVLRNYAKTGSLSGLEHFRGHYSKPMSFSEFTGHAGGFAKSGSRDIYGDKGFMVARAEEAQYARYLNQQYKDHPVEEAILQQRKLGAVKPAVKEWPNKVFSQDHFEQKGFSGQTMLPRSVKFPSLPPLPKPYASGFVPNFNLTKLANLGGSTGAELMQDPYGEKFVRKFGASAGHLINEFEANKIYRSLGIPVPDTSLHRTSSGKPYMLSKYLQGATDLGTYMRSALPDEKASVMKQIQDRTARISLMADWDAVGMSEDNMMVDKKGRVIQIDSGGALHYRAMGGLKGNLFGSQVGELNTMRDPMNAGGYFSSVTDESLRKQIAGISEGQIVGRKKTRDILLQRLAMMRRFGDGFVPNFNISPLDRALNAERMGLKQQGSAARPQVGYDARVGVGVYNTSQGSLSNAINQHLMAGQPPSTLKKTGAARGRVPNFFMGDMGMDSGAAMLGFAAMGFMGMGGPDNKREAIQRYQEDAVRNQREADASRKELAKQTSILDKIKEDSRTQTQRLTELNQTQETLKNDISKTIDKGSDRAFIAAQKAGIDLGFSEDKETRQKSTAILRNELKLADAGGTDTARQEAAKIRKELAARQQAGANVGRAFEQQKQVVQLQLQDSAEQKNLVKEQMANTRAQKAQAEESMKLSKQAADDAKKGTIRDPKTGNAYKNQRTMKFAQGMGRYGLGITMAAPILAGMAGQSMFPGDTESARRNRAAATGVGSAASMAGMGAMIGSGFGPKGALVGGAIGGLVGAGMGISGYADEVTNFSTDLSEAAKKSVDELNKFNVGTQQTTRAYASYIKALQENTGQISAQEMQRRRSGLTEAISQIPVNQRSAIIRSLSSGGLEGISAEGSRISNVLRRRAESDAAASEFQGQIEGGMSGSFSTFVEDKFKRGVAGFFQHVGNTLDQLPVIGSRGDYVEIDTAYERERKRLRETGHFTDAEANRLAAGDAFKQFEGKAGQSRLRRLGNDLIGGSTLHEMDPERILELMGKGFRESGGQRQFREERNIEKTLMAGGIREDQLQMIRGLRPEDRQQIANTIRDFAHSMMDAEEATKILEGIADKNKKAAQDNREAAEQMGLAMLQTETAMRNAVKNFSALVSGRNQIRDIQQSGIDQRNLATMRGGVGVLSPFLSREQSLDYANRAASANNAVQAMAKFRGVRSGGTSGVFDVMQKGIGKVGERQNRFLRGMMTGGDDADVLRQETLQKKVATEFNAMNAIFGRLQGLEKQGIGGVDLINEAQRLVQMDPTLSQDDKQSIAIQNELLSELTNLRIKTDAQLAKISVESENATLLQQLQNEFAKESLRISRNLEQQGGISEFRAGPLASLGKLDAIQQKRNAIMSSPLNQGVNTASQNFQEVEFLRNYFGQREIPQASMESAIAGRAAQMASMAREARARGGTLGAGITDEMMTVGGNLEAAEDQVKAALKDGIPERLEKIRSQVETAEQNIAKDASSQSDKIVGAMKDIFGDNYGVNVINSLNDLAFLRADQSSAIKIEQGETRKRNLGSSVTAELLNLKQLANMGYRHAGPAFLNSKSPIESVGDTATSLLRDENDALGRTAGSKTLGSARRGLESLKSHFEFLAQARGLNDQQAEILESVKQALEGTVPAIEQQVEEYRKLNTEVANYIDLRKKARDLHNKKTNPPVAAPQAAGAQGAPSGPNFGPVAAEVLPMSAGRDAQLQEKIKRAQGIAASMNAAEPNRPTLAVVNPKTGVIEFIDRKRIGDDGTIKPKPDAQATMNATAASQRQARLTSLGNQMLTGDVTMRSILSGMGMSEGAISTNQLTDLSAAYNNAMMPVTSGRELPIDQAVDQTMKQERQRIRVHEKLKEAIEKANKSGVTFTQRVNMMKSAMADAAAEGKFARGEMSGREYADDAVRRARRDARTGAFDPRTDTMDLVRSQFAYNEVDKMEDYQRLIVETARTFKSEFKGAFKSFIDGSKGSKEAFRDFATSILDRITDITTDMAFDALFGGLFGTPTGGRLNKGGRVGKFSKGGFVNMGGSGVRDDVPAMLTEGEFVVNAKAARQNAAILSAINTGQRLASGGSISSLVTNRFDYDDEKRPTTGVMNVSDKLSLIGQEDTHNPQNRRKFERQDALFAYRKSEHDREERNRKAQEQFEKERSGKLMMGVISSVVNMLPVLGEIGSGTLKKIGKFAGSTGGLALTSAGLGAIAGGTRGAVLGGVTGAAGGVLKNRLGPEIAANRRKEERAIREDLATKAANAAAAQKANVDFKQKSARKSLFGNLFSDNVGTFANRQRQEYFQKMFEQAGGVGQAPRQYNSGGIVNGLFGGGTPSDNVPAMLTEGEFVVNRQAAAMNMDLLKSINGGKVKGYARGGYVSSDAAARDTGSSIIGTDIGSSEVSESIIELIEEVRSVRGAIEDQSNRQEIDRQSGNNLSSPISPNQSGPASVTNNINISVSMDEGGAATAQTSVDTMGGGSETNASDREQALDRIERERELAEKIKNGAVSVIQDEQRPGGLLYKQGGFR